MSYEASRQAAARRIWRNLLRLEAALIGLHRDDLSALAADARAELERLVHELGARR